MGAPAGELPRRRECLDPCWESKKRGPGRPADHLLACAASESGRTRMAQALHAPVSVSRLAASLLKVCRFGGWRLGLASSGWLLQATGPVQHGTAGSSALGLLGWAGAWQGWSTVCLAARVGWMR